MNIVNIYAPVEGTKVPLIKTFYKELTTLYKNRRRKELYILAGDWNGAVGRTYDDSLAPMCGKHGFKYGTMNNNSDWIIDFMGRFHLKMINSFFNKKSGRKWTWKGNNSKKGTEIDFFVCSRLDIFTNVDSYSDKSNLSDHRIVKATTRFSTKRETSRRYVRNAWKETKRKEVDKDSLKNAIEEELEYRLPSPPSYDDLCRILLEAHSKCAAPVEEKSKLSKETKELLKKRMALKMDPTASACARKEANVKARKAVENDISAWKEEKMAKTMEKRSSIRRTKRGFEHDSIQFNQLTLEDGSVTRNRDKIREELKSHFSKFYLPGIPAPSAASIPHIEAPEILESEVVHAIKTTKSATAPGLDRIDARMLKAGGPIFIKILTRLFNDVFLNGPIPPIWKRTKLKMIPKKSNPKTMKDYRPISILSIVAKCFTKIMCNRIKSKAESSLGELQNGFRPGRSCSDNLQIIAQVWEKCDEFKIPLLLAFVDFKAAFDTISWDIIMKALRAMECDAKVADSLAQCNSSATAELDVHGTKLKFGINRGVKQGDTSSPTLFALGLERILNESDPQPEDNDLPAGILIDGQYLNRIMFADDLVVFSQSPSELQSRLSAIKSESEKYGLQFNTDKTVIMRNAHSSTTAVKVGASVIQDVDQVKYLGRTFRKDASLESEVSNRIRSAWAAYHNVADFLNHATSSGKIKVLLSYVLPSALYGSETWNARASDYSRIQRTINSIWEAANAGNAPIAKKLIISKKLTWAGHVARQPTGRWSHKVTMWDPRGFTRKKGRPTTRWSNDIIQAVEVYKHKMASEGKITRSRRRIGMIEKRFGWSTIAKDREIWKVLIHCFEQADNGSHK